jgi:hypothetical protein
MSDAKNVFLKIVEEVHSRPTAIFDLDSTLFAVSHRTAEIFRSLIKNSEFLGKHPDLAQLMTHIQVTEKDWGIHEPLSRLGIDAQHPAFPYIRKFWQKSFFSDDFLPHDQPYPGAVEYVNSLHEKGVSILYLTGRDAPNMRKGSLEMLRRWKFPLLDEAHLVMKDSKGSVSDEGFKTMMIKDLRLASANSWFFENEPVILHQVEKDHPQMRLVFLDTVHSGRAPEPKHLPRIPGNYHI